MDKRPQQENSALWKRALKWAGVGVLGGVLAVGGNRDVTKAADVEGDAPKASTATEASRFAAVPAELRAAYQDQLDQGTKVAALPPLGKESELTPALNVPVAQNDEHFARLLSLMGLQATDANTVFMTELVVPGYNFNDKRIFQVFGLDGIAVMYGYNPETDTYEELDDSAESINKFRGFSASLLTKIDDVYLWDKPEDASAQNPKPLEVLGRNTRLPIVGYTENGGFAFYEVQRPDSDEVDYVKIVWDKRFTVSSNANDFKVDENANQDTSVESEDTVEQAEAPDPNYPKLPEGIGAEDIRFVAPTNAMYNEGLQNWLNANKLILADAIEFFSAPGALDGTRVSPDGRTSVVRSYTTFDFELPGDPPGYPYVFDLVAWKGVSGDIFVAAVPYGNYNKPLGSLVTEEVPGVPVQDKHATTSKFVNEIDRGDFVRFSFVGAYGEQYEPIYAALNTVGEASNSEDGEFVGTYYFNKFADRKWSNHPTGGGWEDGIHSGFSEPLDIRISNSAPNS